MTSRTATLYPAQLLTTALATYQAEAVIPHCGQCKLPCCTLETLVLDLEWRQFKVLWAVAESRGAFDRRLAAGQGPEEIRVANGHYYAHKKPCPAYDKARKNCRVYDQPVKPPGCSDFPVYHDGDVIVADLRCEAVDLAALKARIQEAVGAGWRIAETADRDFPFLVSLALKPAAGSRRR